VVLLRWSCHRGDFVGEDVLVSDGGDPDSATRERRVRIRARSEANACWGVNAIQNVDEPAVPRARDKDS